MEKPSPERRKYVRIKKNFILNYHVKNHPQEHFEVSQLKNISLGGMCFVASKSFPPSTKISIELKTPYLANTVNLEGSVLEANEKLKNILYEIRLQFDKLNPQAEFIINKIIEYFQKEVGQTA